MKSRTRAQALRRGGPVLWTGDDLDRAMEVTNALYSQDRDPVTPELRAKFCEALRAEEGRIPNSSGRTKTEARRQAISRALVARGILEIRRSRIPPSLKSFFRANIS